MRQVAALREIAGLNGVRVLAVSPDTPDESRALIREIEADGDRGVIFSLLSDPGSVIIDRYALRDPSYDGQARDGLPRPAVFVLDRDLRVVWSRVETDYRQRPANAEILAALGRADREG